MFGAYLVTKGIESAKHAKLENLHLRNIQFENNPINQQESCLVILPPDNKKLYVTISVLNPGTHEEKWVMTGTCDGRVEKIVRSQHGHPDKIKVLEELVTMFL